MGIRYRKRVKILPGLYINISKSGISTTIGPRGASVNIGKNGTYLNTGIPGTGLYSRDKISGPSNSHKSGYSDSDNTNYSDHQHGTYGNTTEYYTITKDGIGVPVFKSKYYIAFVIAIVFPIVGLYQFCYNGWWMFESCLLSSLANVFCTAFLYTLENDTTGKSCYALKYINEDIETKIVSLAKYHFIRIVLASIIILLCFYPFYAMSNMFIKLICTWAEAYEGGIAVTVMTIFVVLGWALYIIQEFNYLRRIITLKIPLTEIQNKEEHDDNYNIQNNKNDVCKTDSPLRKISDSIHLEECTEEQVAEKVENNDVFTNTNILEPYDPKLDLLHYKYPTLDLLNHFDDNISNISIEEQQANKNKLIRVLSSYGIEISSIKLTVGPSLSLYQITLAPGIPSYKLKKHENDIALSLSARSIRIFEFHGMGIIGIEIPNAKPQMVSMESVINCRKFQETDFDLPLVLGKTMTGDVYMLDLAKAPHILIAGSTGQGKSVALNVIIISLLFKKHPAELKLALIDPRILEFAAYSKISNHFLAQTEDVLFKENDAIISDTRNAIHTLNSLCSELDIRYKLLVKAGVRNINNYNQKFKDRQLNPNDGHKFMPFIVTIIDSFSDLTFGHETEFKGPLTKLVKLGRAVGIHIVIATGRPSSDIIASEIKTYFPVRISFRLPERVDSCIILDNYGAENLLGNGDMIIKNGETSVRVQCPFIDTYEIDSVTSYIACQQSYNAPFPLPEVPMGGGEDGDEPDVDLNHLDPMFNEVARMVVLEQSGSTSMIQRKFSIGYNQAGRLMDQLEKVGIVGPAKGSKPREVLCFSEEDLKLILDKIGLILT